MSDYLGHLPPLAVARAVDFKANEPFRITAGLKLHPLAPDARGKMEEMVSGEDPSARQSGEPGQEVSVSLGRLIRFFYRGDASQSDLLGAFRSQPFNLRELSHASD